MSMVYPYIKNADDKLRAECVSGFNEKYPEGDKRKMEATDMPEDLCYLSGQPFEEYLHDVEVCHRFARRNREMMATIILDRTGMRGTDAFHTIHNYIDTDEMILRKGAIAAHEGEKVLIPINMRDGSILAIGKGNFEWNLPLLRRYYDVYLNYIHAQNHL